MASEPLDEQRLAEIRARAMASWQMLENSNTISVEVALTRDSLALLAEVEYLRDVLFRLANRYEATLRGQDIQATDDPLDEAWTIFGQ